MPFVQDIEWKSLNTYMKREEMKNLPENEIKSYNL